MPHKTSILIIYTGGTIGMVQDQKTGSLKPFRFDNILEEVPELKKFGFNLSSFAFNPPLDSSNIKPAAWVKVAEIIGQNYENFDGFIVLHGTDTMAYSASALSFMLENLSKPVIFTGSQLPIGSLRTDGKENLISSVEIAAALKDGEAVVPEVGIYFENRLYRGNRTTKNNTEDFNAFISGNYPALAESGVHIRYNHSAIHYEPEKRPLIVHKDLNNNLAILKLFPGVNRSAVESAFSIPGLRAVILETFGAGNAPEEEWFLKCVRNAQQKEIIIFNVTQCQTGSVEMGLYETSRKLAEAGVVSGRDITTEAAVAKIMYLTGVSSDYKWIAENLAKSLRGEMTV
ncbi:MAG TPA: type I asparaginase [Bacteroidales bacterium]|jgi:L-asparaginase|nr:type I asparaginase [Bacteroidales bacterium]